MIKTSRFELILSLLFAIQWILWAISPISRHDWLLENVLVFVIVAVLVLTYKNFKFSKLSYFMMFIFLSIHIIGAHYTYSLVPYREWFGLDLNGRNHFDRFAHFLFGSAWVYPAKEFYFKKIIKSNGWSSFLALQSVATFSFLYELIEWGAMLYFGGQLGMEYLGTQGDIWDAQKDMLMAALGGILTIFITYIWSLKNEN
ncbi:MAG: DUF2238 domain-containing protein [Sulfurovaceae bacterium]|nr:DUF2238 domain-containing protein [Sulfurovaceae bacterium]MDD5549362.1 DUF2238 domain-containing protein [Sulfurovaceae bacterium]